ncbi:MAG TPA: hypothetical protein VFL57_14990 [Bryobacteraceae bacterium]|nr:hypothetical protein [Bryobacteraceae bacterium]
MSELEELPPVVTLRDLHESGEALRNRLALAEPAEFRYPIQPSPRCAVLGSGFRGGAKTAVVANWQEIDLSSFADTTALAAPVSVLCRLAERRCELLYPVVAFTGPCYGTLSESDRECIWRAFGVPVYEQFLGARNELLAEECDAHDGLHVRHDRAWFDTRGGELVVTSFANLAWPVLRLATGLRGTIERGLCACGRSGFKLRELTPMPQTLAAIA